MRPELQGPGAGQGFALRTTQPLSAVSLALVVAAHIAALAALMALRPPAATPPARALMVEVIAAATIARAPAPTPPAPAVTPPKPLPVKAQSQPPAATSAPVLATEGPAAPMAEEAAKPAPPSPLPRTQSTAVAAAPAAASPAAATATAPRFDADYLDNPAPAYPPLSRRQHEEGKVVLHVYVEASGLAGKVELHTSSGFERLDRSAISAVSRWKFAPARQGTEAVGAWVLVPLVFSLKG